MGISFMITYIICLLQVFLIAKVKYEYTFSNDFVKMFLIQLLCAVACFCVVKFVETPYHYIAGSGLIGLSAMYSIKELNRKMELKKLILLKLKKQ